MSPRPALLLALCGLVASAAPLHAQAAEPSSKEQAIRELMDLTGAAALGAQAMDQMMEGLRPSFVGAYPDVPVEVMSALFNEVQAEIARVDLVSLVVPIYDRHFTEDDVRGLIAFYESPLGRRTIERMPAVMQESMAVGMEWGEAAGRRAAEALARRLEEKGYAPTR